MTQQQSNPTQRTLPASSVSFPTCRECSDTGFVVAKGGVIRCNCRKKKETPNPPTPSPTPVAACSIPSDKARNQRERMIVKMEERGEEGVTNRKFIEMGIFRYSSRLHEIRRERNVDTIPVRGGLYRYVIKPGRPRPLPACESKKSTDTVPPLFAGVGQ